MIWKMPGEIHFNMNPGKVIEALVYIAAQRPGIDVFHVCKVLFYADIAHFRRYGRPIVGDQYVAMHSGPVPSFAYNVIKRDPRNVPRELIEKAERRIAFDDSGEYTTLKAKRSFDDRLFSRTDIECLSASVDKYADMPFLELWRLVHKEPAYKTVYHGDHTSIPIPYDLLLPARVQGDKKTIEYLRETSKLTVL